MKYYVFEISTGDNSIKGKAVYEYATEKEAVASLHSKIGTAMKSSLFSSELVIVIDEFGNVLKREHYVADASAAQE